MNREEILQALVEDKITPRKEVLCVNDKCPKNLYCSRNHKHYGLSNIEMGKPYKNLNEEEYNCYIKPYQIKKED